MKTTEAILSARSAQDCGKRFENAMRLVSNSESAPLGALDINRDALCDPNDEDAVIREVIDSESVIRPLATELKKHQGSTDIWATDSDDYAAFLPENDSIPGCDVENDFRQFPVKSHKLAGLVKVSEEFVHDADFDLTKYISKRMGESFARTEDRAFVNGNGVNEPFGLLHDEQGAETGVSADAITFDSVIDLFFSVKPKYRKHGVWLMNDRTAQALQKLKDRDGNYLWNGNNDTILGKSVQICNEMPDIAAGAKPILFGDFRYYWIVERSPISMKVLKERFAMTGRIGYAAFEMLDARLVRRDAVKAVFVTGESE